MMMDSKQKFKWMIEDLFLQELKMTDKENFSPKKNLLRK